MTASELITELSKYPPDWVVKLETVIQGEDTETFETRDISFLSIEKSIITLT